MPRASTSRMTDSRLEASANSDPLPPTSSVPRLRRKGWLKGDEGVREPVVGPQQSTYDISVEETPEIPTEVLTVVVTGKPILEEDRHQNLCTVCKNGGSFVLCETCDRVVCSECISLPDEIEQAGGHFICPFCHKSDSTGRKKLPIRPYKMGEHRIPFRGLATQRQLLSMSCTDPLVIFSMRPSQVSPHDLPARMVFDHLHPYLQGNIAYVDIDFNFSTAAFADSYKERLYHLVSELRIGTLKRFKRFAIFLADGSPPGYRGPPVAPSESERPLRELFQKIFPDEFCGLLNSSMTDTSRNSLTLLTRNGILSDADTYGFLRELTARQHFALLTAFSQPNLYTCAPHSFLLALHLDFHVYLRYSLDRTVCEHDLLGQYTDIVAFQKHSTTRYVWSHPGNKPFGHAVPAQCTTCGSIYPYKKTQEKEELVVLKCSHCKATQEYTKDPGLLDIVNSQGVLGGTWFKVVM